MSIFPSDYISYEMRRIHRATKRIKELYEFGISYKTALFMAKLELGIYD